MILSIEDESIASCKESVRIKISGFGIFSTIPLSSPSLRLARVVCFITALVSTSQESGRVGIIYCFSLMDSLTK